MKIRKAKLDDVEIMFEIEKNSGYPLEKYFTSKEHFTKMVKEGFAFILENEMGFSVLFENKKFSDGIELDDICVLKSEHRKGYGKMLLEHSIKFAKDKEYNKIYVYCWNKNFEALTFYKKNGFYVVTEDKGHYSGGETALVLVKDL
ncbi:GNAT family N-acetyltransferase [Candidatus Aenigmatarchaeota archaeon]